MKFTMDEIDYEHIQVRAVRLMDERLDALLHMEDTYGELEDYQAREMRLLTKMRRTYRREWTGEQCKYMLDLIEAEDNIIEGSYN